MFYFLVLENLFNNQRQGVELEFACHSPSLIISTSHYETFFIALFVTDIETCGRSFITRFEFSGYTPYA